MRIGEDARKCVVFFGIETPQGVQYGGTGFLLVDSERGVGVPFLVTCRHVAETLAKFDQFFMRVNTKDGGAISIAVEKADWKYPVDKSVDLAAVLHGFPSGSQFDVVHYQLVDKKSYFDPEKPNAVMGGDVINIVGLFRLHHGKQRNVPFVHTGHIAVLADPKNPVPMSDRLTGKKIDVEAFLVEAQTLEGLSGSPTFLQETVQMEVGHAWIKPVAFVQAILLGVYSGSWDGRPGDVLADDRSLQGIPRVPVGVGTVVPVTHLIKLIRENPEMKKIRDAWIDHQLSLVEGAPASQD